MTFPSRLTTAGSPDTLTWPCSYASAQCFRRPSLASSLKCERETTTASFASPAGSFVTLGPGTSMRQIGAPAPRVGSSRRTTSLSCLSAGTSAVNCSSVCSISTRVSVDATTPILWAFGWVVASKAPAVGPAPSTTRRTDEAEATLSGDDRRPDCARHEHDRRRDRCRELRSQQRPRRWFRCREGLEGGQEEGGREAPRDV